MCAKLKFNIIISSVVLTFFTSLVFAEEEEIYLQAISDQIQIITKDLKTLEKAVYQKSDLVSATSASQTKSNGNRIESTATVYRRTLCLDVKDRRTRAHACTQRLKNWMMVD